MKKNLTIDKKTLEIKGMTTLEKSLLKDYIAQNILYEGLNDISCDSEQSVNEMTWKAYEIYKDGLGCYNIEGYVFYRNIWQGTEKAWFSISFSEDDGIHSAMAIHDKMF